MATPDYQILVGVQGGFSIKEGSGKLIKNHIEGIIRQIQASSATKLKLTPDVARLKTDIESMTAVQIPIDQKHIQEQISAAINGMPKQKMPTGDGSGGKGGGRRLSQQEIELRSIQNRIKQINKYRIRLFDV